MMTHALQRSGAYESLETRMYLGNSWGHPASRPDINPILGSYQEHAMYRDAHIRNISNSMPSYNVGSVPYP